MKRFLLFHFFVLVVGLLIAQPPAGYYDAADKKKEAQLKTSLYTITSTGYVQKTYSDLWTIYKTSDRRPDGKVWDMYSTCTWTFVDDQCGNYSSVCDCYNREHSIPQSWFDSRSPMVSDAHHIFPTDGKVNGQRSNYPFGECASGSTLSGGRGRLGSSTYPGYSGTVFEPDDEFKGDFARAYFYFATRYENIMTNIGGESFSGNTYPAITTWSLNMFLEWHREDPVSEKETVRNDAIYAYQKNRNPFVDYPELAEHIWGNKKTIAWNLSASVDNPEAEVLFSFDKDNQTITLSPDSLQFNYRVISISGQVVLKGKAGPTSKISVASLYSGMYLIQYDTVKSKGVRKFIVQK